ncbi:hypothetical protein [[Eubacterium] cellulosolvens]
MRNKKEVMITIKGPHIVSPSRKYRFTMKVKTGEMPYYGTKLSIPRPLYINYPVAPLGWDDKDSGQISDHNWRLHYYLLGDMERRSEREKNVEFISSPRSKLGFYILTVTFAGFSDPEHQKWGEIAEKNKIFLNLPNLRFSQLFRPKSRLTSRPDELLPSSSEVTNFGWSPLDSYFPPLQEVEGYNRGIAASYRSISNTPLKNRPKTIIVGIYKFNSRPYAEKYFDKQCDMWLDMHRSETNIIRSSKILGSDGIVWMSKKGVIYNWLTNNYIFSIHGINVDTQDLDNFLVILSKKSIH